MRVVLSAVLTVHGLIHFMGFAKAFGLAELPQLTQPIARPLGLLWLLAGLLTVGAAWLPLRHYWVVGILAALLSQAVVLSSWSDAKFGTLPNVIAVLVGLYSFVAFGPFSLRAAFASDAAAVLQNATSSGVLTDADLARLPAPAQHQRLPVAAHVGHQPQALRVAHQRAALAFVRQRVVVARLLDPQLVAGVARAGVEDQRALVAEHALVEVTRCRKLRAAVP